MCESALDPFEQYKGKIMLTFPSFLIEQLPNYIIPAKTSWYLER